MTRRLAAFIVLLPFVLAPATLGQGPSHPGPPDASWARLNGRVVDGVTGKPATDVPVLLQCAWLNGRWGRLEGATDANGQFSIGTPAGQCTLALNMPPGASAEGAALRLFEFAPGETFETVRKLENFPADGKFLPNIRALDGYLITPLVPGRYRIRTTGIPSGYRIKSVTIGGRDVTEDGFDLGDAPINNIIVTLTKQFTELKGMVKDAQDRPDGEAAVLAFPTNRQLWTTTGQIPAFIGNAHVSQKGNYSVKGLPAGE